MFVTFLGTHASGKSAFTGVFAKCLGIDIVTEKQEGQRKKPKVHTDDTGKCVLVGAYGQREDGVYTGGLDGAGTQLNRYQMVKEQWLNPRRKVIIAESHMIWYWESFWDKIRDELMPKMERKILLLFLEVPMEELIRRWQLRSGGKEFTENRQHHLELKANKSEKLPRELQEDPVLGPCVVYNRMPHVDAKDMDIALSWAINEICKHHGWSLGNDLTWKKS
jgi:hypothetical protein